MKSYNNILRLVVVLSLAPNNIVHGQSTYDVIIGQFKRFGTACVLEGDGRKTTRQQTLDEIMRIDDTLSRCFQSLVSDGTSKAIFARTRGPDSTLKTEAEKVEKTVEEYCALVTEITVCIAPLESLYRKCKSTEGLALVTFAKQICKNRGTPIIEFLRAGGIDSCYSQPNHELDACTAAPGSLIKDSPTRKEDFLYYLRRNTCKVASNFINCHHQAINKCNNQKAKALVEKFVNDLKGQSPEAGKCFFNTSSKPKPAPRKPTGRSFL